MKTLSFCIALFSMSCVWSQIQLKGLNTPKTTIHISAQTPVKDQGNGNTCSAFGIAAALETLPNMPKDISENFLYSSQKYEQFEAETGVTRGSFLKSYIMSLPKYGILTEAELPYPDIPAGKWNDNDSDVVKALKESTTGPVSFIYKYKSKAKLLTLHAYEYLGQVESKNVAHLKYLLDNGVKAIPVSYELYVPGWNKFQDTKYNTITPDAGYGILMKDGSFQKYSEIKKQLPDLNTRINNRTVTFLRTVKPTPTYNPYGGHVVTIVGYDAEGFIIKNSWGADWRYFGYERISFDYHEIFAYEALVFKRVTFAK
ncbi:papain like protease [Kordia periserrulae]|uniref:Papain like protease n=1 Tax=Kordia periserrulae TaxID=701523 RepID=A0A2T6BWG3_9FLAO|nr:C1 family peptidase [Kordia periserrulae]PTX60376.1 papain like protease [Kordia periserrulae]